MRRVDKAPERVSPCTRRGFTLLEVLAAVLVLGMLYSVLAEVAIQGLRAEGEGRRRLEASLFADELLSEVETSLASEGAPALGISVDEYDPYVIELEVRPLVVDALLLPGIPGEDPALLNRLGTDPEENPVREIVLKVSWSEGDRELSVTRTTLGLTSQGFAPLSAGAEAGNPAAGSAGAVPGTGASANTQPSQKNTIGRNTIGRRNLSAILNRRADAHAGQGNKP